MNDEVKHNSPDDKPPVYHAWDARLIHMRCRIVRRLTSFRGLLWAPSLVLAAVLYPVIGIGASLTEFNNPVAAEFARLVHSPYAFMVLCIVCFFSVRGLVGACVRGRVRLVAWRLYASDMALLIVDGQFRPNKAGRELAWLNAGSRQMSLLGMIERAAAIETVLWQFSGKNQAAAEAIAQEVESSIQLKSVVVVFCFLLLILICLVSPLFALPVVAILAVPAYLFARQVDNYAAMIAISDYFTGESHNYYHRWSMPLRRVDDRNN